MTETLRPYQANGFEGVVKHWENGVRRVLLVAPTGAGKTVLASAFCDRELSRGSSVLFVVHRRELVRQTALRFRARFGHANVGVVLPGEDGSPHSRIQVGTVQTLIARKIRPDVQLVIFDEAHHYAADDWAELFHSYDRANLLGLTATPERQDGKPLGDLFDELVVAAKYSELLRDGFLVPCVIYQPPPLPGSGDLAQDPLIAYQRYAADTQAFVFCASVEAAEALAVRFTEAGIPARCIEAKTKKRAREEALMEYEAGRVRIITNVNTMTEGVDVPQTGSVILAKPYRHIGGFLQAAGRGLRPSPGKSRLILIDLVGATMQAGFGFPTDDREYSLDGEGIKSAATAPVRVCSNCLATFPSRPGGCPECGHVAPVEERERPQIWDMELSAVYAHEATPDDAKSREYARLRAEGKKRGWSLYFVQKEYRKLFGELPVIKDATEDEMAEEYARLTDLAERNGWKAGYAMVNFKKLFGCWPSARVKGRKAG